MSNLSGSTPIDPQAIRGQLTKIVSSTEFADSPRMTRFLEFVVEETLKGRGR